MRPEKIIIPFLTFICLAGVLLSWMYGLPQEEVEIPFSFLVNSENGYERISCWKNEEDECFVFLPEFAQMTQLYLRANDEQVYINDLFVPDGMSCEGFACDTPYDLSCEKDGNRFESTITFVRTGDMPTLYIDVASGNMEYIHLEKGYEESGEIRLYEKDGSLSFSGVLESIKGRGNSSWSADKKPYSLTFSEDADLLHMGPANRWILLAEGYYSCLNLRNKIVYDVAQAVGMDYTPEGKWVNLYLNGDYAGLYLLSERNEVHPERVGIDPENCFLVSMEWDIRLEEQKYPHILTDAGQALRIHHSSLSAAELDRQWQSAENAIMAEDGVDPVSGKAWQELIDLDSWARKYVLEEVFGNHDGGSFSQFYYYDAAEENAKIHAGPIWDYDLAMGGYDVWLKYYTNYLIMDREYKEDGLYTPWHHALYQKELFRTRVAEIYEEEFLPLLQQLLMNEFDSYIAQASDAFRTDALRWGNSQTSLQQEIEYIRNFLSDRIAFLSDVWISGTEYHIVRVDPGRKDVYGHFAVKHGECLPELPSYDDIRGLGWFVVGTDEPFDVTQPIYEDVQIYIRKQPFEIPKIHYIPAAVLMLAVPLLLLLDRIRTKKNGRIRNDPAKTR